MFLPNPSLGGLIQFGLASSNAILPTKYRSTAHRCGSLDVASVPVVEPSVDMKIVPYNVHYSAHFMKPDLSQDLLYGAKAIAEVLGCKPRAVYHLAERGRMPIWNEPGIGLVARKSSLIDFFEKREQQTLVLTRK